MNTYPRRFYSTRMEISRRFQVRQKIQRMPRESLFSATTLPAGAIPFSDYRFRLTNRKYPMKSHPDSIRGHGGYSSGALVPCN